MDGQTGRPERAPCIGLWRARQQAERPKPDRSSYRACLKYDRITGYSSSQPRARHRRPARHDCLAMAIAYKWMGDKALIGGKTLHHSRDSIVWSSMNNFLRVHVLLGQILGLPCFIPTVFADFPHACMQVRTKLMISPYARVHIKKTINLKLCIQIKFRLHHFVKIFKIWSLAYVCMIFLKNNLFDTK